MKNWPQQTQTLNNNAEYYIAEIMINFVKETNQINLKIKSNQNNDYFWLKNIRLINGTWKTTILISLNSISLNSINKYNANPHLKEIGMTNLELVSIWWYLLCDWHHFKKKGKKKRG